MVGQRLDCGVLESGTRDEFVVSIGQILNLRSDLIEIFRFITSIISISLTFDCHLHQLFQYISSLHKLLLINLMQREFRQIDLLLLEDPRIERLLRDRSHQNFDRRLQIRLNLIFQVKRLQEIIFHFFRLRFISHNFVLPIVPNSHLLSPLWPWLRLEYLLELDHHVIFRSKCRFLKHPIFTNSSPSIPKRKYLPGPVPDNLQLIEQICPIKPIRKIAPRHEHVKELSLSIRQNRKVFTEHS